MAPTLPRGPWERQRSQDPERRPASAPTAARRVTSRRICWALKRSKETEKNAQESNKGPKHKETRETKKDGEMGAAFDAEQPDKLLATTYGEDSSPSTWFIDSGVRNRITGGKDVLHGDDQVTGAENLVKKLFCR
ncbi:MAG: hypothetical protein M1840_000445 [Geoglossum simile]|nr:MAG: hypothetical protein M1840_000445 [Geoglossum simile]